MKAQKGTIIPTKQDEEAVRKIVSDLGEREAVKQLGTNSPTLVRVAARFPVREGTLAILRTALQSLK